jgi:hypothetical protein
MSFFPRRLYTDRFLPHKAKYKLSPLRHATTCIRSEWGGRERGVGEEKPHNLHQAAACNISHQPRLAGAKVSLHNKWYLTDTIFNAAVKGNA